MTLKSQKRVLVAPLNWGLGHATRCIPIIRILLETGTRVDIASDGVALDLLKKEFPQLNFYSLPTYNAKYPTKNVLINIALQSPHIAKAILAEKATVAKLQRRNKYDLILSDNRFGVQAKGATNVIISHQLHLKSPFAGSSAFGNTVNKFWLKTFDEIWVPDYESNENLSGTLSHPKLNKTTHYIGALTRLAKPEKPVAEDPNNILLLLSGPEPQRSIFEKKLREQAKHLPYKFTLVQGLPSEEIRVTQEGNITVYNFLLAEELQEKIHEAGIIVSRSGYTTVMDLFLLRKKAIMIPTPGQTEQEYLAEHLDSHSNFTFGNQKEFNLKQLIQIISEKKISTIVTAEDDTLEKQIMSTLKLEEVATKI